MPIWSVSLYRTRVRDSTYFKRRTVARQHICSGPRVVRRRGHRPLVSDAIALPLLVGAGVLAAADIGRRIYRHTQIFLPSREPVRSWDPAAYGIPAGAGE